MLMPTQMETIMWKLQQRKTNLIRKVSCVTLFSLGICSWSLPKCFIDNVKGISIKIWWRNHAIHNCSCSHYKLTTLLFDKQIPWNPNAVGPLFGTIRIPLLWLQFKEIFNQFKLCCVPNSIPHLCQRKVTSIAKERQVNGFSWQFLFKGNRAPGKSDPLWRLTIRPSSNYQTNIQHNYRSHFPYI